MKISVITVVYNGAATLAETIESVLGQDYPLVEYIVVDGASTDGTAAVLERYADRIDTVVSEPDQGLYDAMNKGWRLATGELVGMLNADDVYAHPAVLRRVAETLGEADSLYADLAYVAAEDPTRVVRYWRSGAYRRDSFLYGWMPPHPTFFVRRACYERYGGFDLSFKSAADYELMLRLLYKHGIGARYLPELTVRMRTGGQSNRSWKNRLRANAEDRAAWRRNGLRPYPYTLWLKPLRKVSQFLQRS